MTGITGILETSRKAMQHATTWTLTEVIDNIPNKALSSILRSSLAGVTPVAEPLVCPQPITPDARYTLALHSNHDPSDTPRGNAAYLDQVPGNQIVAPDELQWALLLPVTARGTLSPSVFWHGLEVTFEKLLESVPPSLTQHTAVYIAFDHNDPVLDTAAALEHLKVRHPLPLFSFL